MREILSFFGHEVFPHVKRYSVYGTSRAIVVPARSWLYSEQKSLSEPLLYKAIQKDEHIAQCVLCYVC